MITNLLIGWCLMALCVAVHAMGLAVAFRWFYALPARAPGFWWLTRLLIRIAGWIVVLHLVEVSLWAVLYVALDGMPDLPSAFYFSSVTYTTVGYGDLVLPPEWRLVGGVEALTGILMCGWSTGFFFAVVSKLFARAHPEREAGEGSATTSA